MPYLATREQALYLYADELARRKRKGGRDETVPDSFGAWLASVPDDKQWDAPHFRAMQAVLDQVTTGALTRVIFTVPVRHGKTEHNTYRYTSYRFKRDERLRVLLGSYNESQVQKFSRDIRRRVRALGVGLSDERDAAGEWETTAGGALRAVGAGAGTASVNADLIVIDDPIGKRADAESAAKREALWDWFTNDILPRAEPHTGIMLTCSRYHADDLTGRLLERQSGEWTVVHLPAIAEEHDALQRKAGEALWPAMRSLAWLEKARASVGSYGFASLYQGRPRPREGGMFRWEWWKVLGDVPVCTQYVRYWDLAGTQPRDGKHDPDYSSGTLVGRMQNDQTCLLHQAAFRKSVNDRDAKLLEIAASDKQRFPRVVWWIEREAGIAGEDRTNAIVRRVQALGVPVYTERPTGSKIDRAEPLQSAAEAGNACLAPDDSAEPWHDAFRLEASDFPHGLHDDRVDSAAGGYNKLTARPPSVVTTFKAY